MHPNITSNADPEILHWIEFVAGTFNNIILSRDQAVLAKFMLQEAEQRLVAKQKSLEAKLHAERLRVALAPHKMVPTDILRIIFRYANTTSITFWCYPPAPKHNPLIFSHVCARWRSVCRSEPSFWNRATFALGSTGNDLTRVKFWMDNFIVDPYGLSLSIQQNGSRHNPEPLQFLLAQHERIRCLELEDVKPFLRMPAHSFPILEDLQISIRPDGLRSSCFVGMENLRTLTIRPIFSKQATFTQMTVPWDRLTSLTIEDKSLAISQAVELLRQCTSLRKCKISASNMQCSISVLDASTLSPLTVHLPHLTDLHFSPQRYNHDYNLSLTHCLITPVLKSLTIHVVEPDKKYATYADPDIGHVFDHAGSSLHTLKILGRVLINATDYKLELLPNLHTLIAPRTIFSRETVHDMIQEILLPSIQMLIIGISSIYTLEHLAMLAETRSTSSSATVPRLRCLIVVVLEEYSDYKLDNSYIQACSERIDACGTEFALHFSETWANNIVASAISSRQLELYQEEA